MKHSQMDPDTHMSSPYQETRVPPPSLAEIARNSGTKPKHDEKSVPLTTRVQPELAWALDRILEKKVYGLKNRNDFVRLAVMNLVTTCVDEIQQKHVKTLVYRLEQMRRLAAEMNLFRDSAGMVEATRSAVRSYLSFNNRIDAIRALRSAKRYCEELPYEGLKARFVEALYGSPDGKERPKNWQEDEAAVLWDEVWQGVADKDDEDEVAEQMRVM